MEIRKGTIKRFSGSWMSGLGSLMIEDSETGACEMVPCENAQTVRALEGCFGDVVIEGHCVDSQGGHIDQEVYWSYDEIGLVLGGFTPIAEASFELEEMYENKRV